MGLREDKHCAYKHEPPQCPLLFGGTISEKHCLLVTFPGLGPKWTHIYSHAPCPGDVTVTFSLSSVLVSLCSRSTETAMSQICPALNPHLTPLAWP